MGLFDEIIQTIFEAMAEGQKVGRPTAQMPQPSAPAQPHPTDVTKMQKRLLQKAAETPTGPGEPAAAHQSQRTATAEKPKPARQPQPAIAHRDRLSRLLRQPQTMRELILLKEILDKPLALRRRHLP